MKNARANVQSQHRPGCCGSYGKHPKREAGRAVTPCDGGRTLAAIFTTGIGHRVTTTPPPELDASNSRVQHPAKAKCAAGDRKEEAQHGEKREPGRPRWRAKASAKKLEPKWLEPNGNGVSKVVKQVPSLRGPDSFLGT